MRIRNSIILLAVSAMLGCSDYDEDRSNPKHAGKILLSGEIEQVYQTRANDNGFAHGDAIGVYFVDYNGTQPGTLLTTGNRGDNVQHTFDASSLHWEPAYDVYWRDDKTHIDIYGYYPYSQTAPEDIKQWNFEVRADQSTTGTVNAMAGYEASDFLWGKVADVAPTSQIIHLPLRHRMSSICIELVEGSGFTAGEYASLDKNVLVKNTCRSAIIDMSTGNVKPSNKTDGTGIIPYFHNAKYRCIVVPQTIEAGEVILAFNIGGMPYSFKKEEPFEFVQGKMHNFTIRIDKKAGEGKYKLTLISSSITAWENDEVSHDATMKEYVIVNSTAGHLKDSVMTVGKDYTQLRNLKITGKVNNHDFIFLREEMPMLQSLNMKEMEMVQTDGKYKMPDGALAGKSTLQRLVLPDKLHIIGSEAFHGCTNLTGSLTVPEGVTRIESGAFNSCRGYNGTLSLPSTLEYIGFQAFCDVGFTCELKFPENVTYIGDYAFFQDRNLYGEIRFPSHLQYLGQGAFEGCLNISGSIEIPQSVTEIRGNLFFGCEHLNGILTLHDGITSINSNAFRGTSLRGDLILPKNLVTLGEGAFYGCDFSGELKLPRNLAVISNFAFAYNWRLSGIIEIPDDVVSIGGGAFLNCRSLEGIIFNQSLENIGYSGLGGSSETAGAFENCFGINSIICKSIIPPYVQDGAFNGVPKDNFALEVPESYIHLYRSENGWREFKRITAHHELVCRPSLACAINTAAKRTLLLDAEGDWVVKSIPDWCDLSQKSGSGKTELTLTIKQMPSGSESRTGNIVFRLKDKDYTHHCTVNQYNYQYGEDEVINLQQATRGSKGGINIVLVGDGYNGKDISEGRYMEDMLQAMEHFFDIEPYKTYRDYFNVNTAIAVSPESGISTTNIVRYNRFETSFAGGIGLRADREAIIDYALRIPTVNEKNINQALIIVIPNTTEYGGISYLYESGTAIAFCPKSAYGYPFDFRGVIQHEAGGHGFGKLADEYIYHNAFIDMCGCSCCGHVDAVLGAKALGWYDNIDVTGKIHDVTWSHLIFDSRYNDIVDMFEGAFMHSRGVYRSEPNSCMNNDIPYYNTISRESIVRRIKSYAGETYSFEEFVKNDYRDADIITRAVKTPWMGNTVHGFQHKPIILKESPINTRSKKKNSKRRML